MGCRRCRPSPAAGRLVGRTIQAYIHLIDFHDHSTYEKLRAGIAWLELSMVKALQVIDMNTVEVQNYHTIRSDIGLPIPRQFLQICNTVNTRIADCTEPRSDRCGPARS